MSWMRRIRRARRTGWAGRAKGIGLAAAACLVVPIALLPGCKNRGSTASTKPAAGQQDPSDDGPQGAVQAAETASSREITANPNILLDPSVVPHLHNQGVWIHDHLPIVPAAAPGAVMFLIA